MNQMPKEPVMLLSYINTQLRDFYSSLEEFCQSTGVEQSQIEEALNRIDYHYHREQNRFI